MTPLLQPPRVARVLAAGVGVATLSAWGWGCASQAQTAPVYGETAPAGSTEAAVREEFDPARSREDLLLIQPVFPPPSVVPELVAPEPSRVETAVTSLPVSSGGGADSVDVTIRVQVIALSRQEGARDIADELRRRFDVPTEVVPQGRLFAVRAGRFASTVDAESLRAQIAALSLGYEGAFLVRDLVREGTSSVEKTHDALMSDGPEADLPAGSLFENSPLLVDALAAEPLIDDRPSLEVESPPEPEELVRVQGWRVLIDQFMDLDAAQQHRRRVVKRLKRDDVDVEFKAPWYKVLAGSFRTSTQAQRFVERCRALGYRTAARVPGEVYLPRAEGQGR